MTDTGPDEPTSAPSPFSAAVIGYVVSNELLDLLIKVDPAPAIQTQRFGQVLLSLVGSAVDRLGSYNFPPVQDYPIARKLWFGSSTHDEDGRTMVTLPFVNVMIMKHITRFLSLLSRFRELKYFNTVLIHGLHLPSLLFAILLKWCGVRIGVVLTDAQGIFLPNDGPVRRALKRIDRDLAIGLTRRFDFAIALSDDLADTYSPDRPTLIIPGVYDNELDQRVKAVPARPSDGRFRVVYFGGLHADYGVTGLLDAVPFLAPGIELRLFGRGPLEKRIAETASREPGLVWGGLVDRERLIVEMASCDLLVNARPAGGDLARLSSPSKLIEYAASGKAVLTTRLPSLSPALMAAALPIDDESPAGIAAAVNAAAAMPPDTRAAQGQMFQTEVRDRYSTAGLAMMLRALLRGDNAARRLRPGWIEGSDDGR